MFTGIIDSNGDRDGIPNVIPEAMSRRMFDSSIQLCWSIRSICRDRVSGYEINPRRPREWVELLEESLISLILLSV